MSSLVRRFLVVLILVGPFAGAAQVNRVDSMRLTLQTNLHDTVRIKTLMRISRTFLNRGLFDSCKKYATPAFKLALKKDFKKGLGNSANALGHYYSHEGIHDSAFYYFGIASATYSFLKDSNQIAGVYNNIANVYGKQGNIPKALDNYFISLKLKERMGDLAGVANACTNIANLYSNFDDTLNTYKYLMKSLTIREQLKDTADIGNSYTALGLFYRKANNFILAEKYLQQAIQMLEHVGDEEGHAIACYNLANVLQAEKKFLAAQSMYKIALDYSIKNSDKEGMASCYEMLAEMKMEMGEYNSAVDFFEKARVIAVETNIAELQANINGKLSTAYANTGDYKKAYEYFRKGIELRDSIFSAQNIQKLTSTELKYEHEKEIFLREAEQQKKDLIVKEQNTKKNITVICSILFLLLMSAFAIVLSRRLKVNRLQKQLIEEQNHDIMDSIKYAKRIQSALMINKDTIESKFPDSFIVFKPKDIVSGDFYWTATNPSSEIGHKEKLFYLAVCDSTGHGVPGAFMSVLNIGFLNEAISEKKITQPHEVFNYVRKRLIESISHDAQKDGMDGVLVCFDRKKMMITYAAANNCPVFVHHNTITEMPYDKQPVGKDERDESFKLYSLPVESGDVIYLYTDGYADQFGGPKGKKFMYKKLNEFLLQISPMPFIEQARLLEEKFAEWKGKLEQVDDVCIVGFKI